MDTQSEITSHDLKLLAIGYYIQGGIVAFYSLLILLYFGFIGALLAKVAANEAGQRLPAGFAAIMSAVFGALFLLCAVYTICIFLAAYFLRHHRNMLFIQIVSGFNCLLVPYGTVLGVFTLIVLARPTAKLFFTAHRAEPGVPPPPAEL
ncbi:MAG TPA: hypothetical protein VGL97_00030 [Bryobacteraceae bacterium]|jgi:hypothetical protein